VTRRQLLALAAVLLLAFGALAWNIYHEATKQVVCGTYGVSVSGVIATPPPGWTETSPGSGCWEEP
jgi:hypothetical protein